MKRTYNKRENITDTTFDFTQQKVQYQIQYQGNGKAPDKRYDKSIQGLCLFVYPSGIKTFYAVRFLFLSIQYKIIISLMKFLNFIF